MISGMLQIDLFFWSDSVDVAITFSRSIHKPCAEGMGKEIEECQQLGVVLLGRSENANGHVFQNEWI